MQVPRWAFVPLLDLLHLPDPQLAYGSKRHCEASRRADQMRQVFLRVAKVLYSGEGKWVGRLCLLSTTVWTFEAVLDASDCERVGDDRGGVQSYTFCFKRSSHLVRTPGKARVSPMGLSVSDRPPLYSRTAIYDSTSR